MRTHLDVVGGLCPSTVPKAMPMVIPNRVFHVGQVDELRADKFNYMITPINFNV
jgi:hypothetical protein